MSPSREWPRRAALLAINLLFLVVWGFAGGSKLVQGKPEWFPDKFGATILARFPGLDATFWLLALGEAAAFILALVALLRGEFLWSGEPIWLRWMLVWSLFLFVQLGFGQWLTNEFNGTFQMFTYLPERCFACDTWKARVNHEVIGTGCQGSKSLKPAGV